MIEMNAERNDMTHKTHLDGAHCTRRSDAKHAAKCHGRSQAGEEEEEHRGQHLYSKKTNIEVWNRSKAAVTNSTEVRTCDL